MPPHSPPAAVPQRAPPLAPPHAPGQPPPARRAQPPAPRPGRCRPPRGPTMPCQEAVVGGVGCRGWEGNMNVIGATCQGWGQGWWQCTRGNRGSSSQNGDATYKQPAATKRGSREGVHNATPWQQMAHTNCKKGSASAGDSNVASSAHAGSTSHQGEGDVGLVIYAPMQDLCCHRRLPAAALSPRTTAAVPAHTGQGALLGPQRPDQQSIGIAHSRRR